MDLANPTVSCDDTAAFYNIRDWKTVSDSAITADGSTSPSAYIQATAEKDITAGPYTLYVSGCRNPRSSEPTSGFNVTTYDSTGNLIATGLIGNTYMTEGGKFTDL
jgi:hypothetical protein